MSLLQFTNEQKLIQHEIRKFAETELEPVADEIEKNEAFPTEIIKKLSELGFLSLIIPEKYGGPDLDTTSLCITLEEVSKVCASVGAILAGNTCFVAFPLLKYGSESQKKKYLQSLPNGEIGGYICHPEFESPDETLEIKEMNGNYIVSGNRECVLNGEVADFFIFPVSLSDGKAFYVLGKERIGQCLTKQDILGIRSSGISSFRFKELELQEEELVIPEEKGETVYPEIREYANIGFSAVSLGIAQAAIEVSLKYSRERVQFGRPICKFPMIQEMIAEMKVKIEAGRFLLYDAAAKCDRGEPYGAASKIARLFCNELAAFAGDKAVQIHGGYGYTRDYPAERYLRDAKALQVIEAIPFILKSEIAGEVLT